MKVRNSKEQENESLFGGNVFSRVLRAWIDGAEQC
jgi:hypothetical protein